MKVFLSPSNQDANVWAVGNTNEQKQAEAFADKLGALLKAQGVTPVRADSVTPSRRINYAKDCDLYVPLHTNGFNGSVRGCRLFVYKTKNGTSAALAKKNDAAMRAIKKEVDKLGMNPAPRLYYDFASWFELNNAEDAGIPAVYSESIFHDNVEDCNWYFANVDKLAEAYARGICAFLGVTYDSKPAPAPAPAGKTVYRVQVGSFSDRPRAEAFQDQLDAAGFKGSVIVTATVDVKKTTEELAREVIAGKWGTGADREKHLTAAGYDYDAVQAVVNKLL